MFTIIYLTGFIGCWILIGILIAKNKKRAVLLKEQGLIKPTEGKNKELRTFMLISLIPIINIIYFLIMLIAFKNIDKEVNNLLDEEVQKNIDACF